MNISKVLLIVSFLVFPVALVSAEGSGTPSALGASVYIISPANGETVSTTVTIKFGLQAMGVAPAGIDKKNTGHHHLLIDAKKLPAFDKPMGKDGIKHFGGGQTEVVLSLKPGEHTLQLVLGDKAHTPHQPPVVSQKITIVVK